MRRAVHCLASFTAIVLSLGFSGTAVDRDHPIETPAGPTFQTSDRCLACHNGLTAEGIDVSIGQDWRGSIMANSSHDPYWRASVRREVIDHAAAKSFIEDECSVCHLPIPRFKAHLRGSPGEVFSQFPLNPATAAGREAADGVSCSVCHQIAADALGTADSFNGGFRIHGAADGVHAEFGPYDIDPGLMRIMRTSSDGYQPTRGDHIRSSQLCATCHTLITKALDAQGHEIGALPEQMPYQEWLHSDYAVRQTCQDCHMPTAANTAISRVLGSPRERLGRHTFIGANAPMQELLARFHEPLQVGTAPDLLASAAARTREYLASQAAHLRVASVQKRADRLEAEVEVENLSGHKFPTAYPSRRAWLHVTVRGHDGAVLFESGALNADGSIRGNDNDRDRSRYEPHYTRIERPDQVQIYESILRDAQGAVTTGLLSATGYLKDNRLLPHGFDKNTASADIAVIGTARADEAFRGGLHDLTYSVALGDARGPFEVQVELWYEPMGFRWADNLRSYDAPEPRAFNAYFDALGSAAAVKVAEVSATLR